MQLLVMVSVATPVTRWCDCGLCHGGLVTKCWFNFVEGNL